MGESGVVPTRPPRIPAMQPIDDHPRSEYVNGKQARLIVGCAPSALQRAVMLGQIRVKLDPGVPPRYHRGDCEELARQALRGTPLQPAGA